MHEVGIVESALALVEEQLAANHAARVERVVLRIGALSGVDIDALRFAFEAVAPQTKAVGAVLDIEEVAAEIHCEACNRDFAGDGSWIFTCPKCGALCGDVRRGRELELSRVELS